MVLGADGSGSHSLQPHHENADIRRRNSRDTRCLTEGGGANLRELLPCFKSQTGNGREIERAWDLFVFERLEFVDLEFLTCDVAGVFHAYFDLSNDLGR